MSRRITPVVLALAVLVGACAAGPSDTGGTTTSDAATVTTSTAPVSTTQGQEAVIEIESFQFGGSSEVEVGTTVTVTNLDSISHTWTSEDRVFDSGTLRQGDSFEFTFEEPGRYSYFCAIHPTQMTGTLVVAG